METGNSAPGLFSLGQLCTTRSQEGYGGQEAQKESIEESSLKAGLRSAPHLSCAGFLLPLPMAGGGWRGHSCIKLLIFVSSTSVSDSGETEKEKKKKKSLQAASILQ